MNNNFFKKHLVTIAIILLLGLFLLIWLYRATNDIKKERELDKTSSEREFDQSTPSKSKRETESSKLKFQKTQPRFDQVKTYILSENDYQTLLPKELSKEEKIEIDKIRKSCEPLLGLLKHKQELIEKYQKEFDDFLLKIQEIQDKFPSLKTKQTNLEKQNKAKEQTIKNFQYIEIQNPQTPNKIEAERLKAKISKLQSEKSEIIGKINVQIKNLETSQEKYEGMLSDATKLKESLQRDYDKYQKVYYNQPLNSLQSLYEITSAEG